MGRAERPAGWVEDGLVGHRGWRQTQADRQRWGRARTSLHLEPRPLTHACVMVSRPQLKRNQWGIPIGIVQNRVEVYMKRITPRTPNDTATASPGGQAATHSLSRAPPTTTTVPKSHTLTCL